MNLHPNSHFTSEKKYFVFFGGISLISVFHWFLVAVITLIFRCHSIKYNKTLSLLRVLYTFEGDLESTNQLKSFCRGRDVKGFLSATSHNGVLRKNVLHHWLTHVNLSHVWRAENWLSPPLPHCEGGPFLTVIIRLFPLRILTLTLLLTLYPLPF